MRFLPRRTPRTRKIDLRPSQRPAARFAPSMPAGLKSMGRGSVSFPAAVILGLLVGAGAAAGGYFIGRGFYQGRAERYVTVKGLVERYVKADLAVWTITFTTTGADISAVSAASERDRELVRSFILKEGFAGKEVEQLPTRVTDQFANPFGAPNVEASRRYVITAGFEIRTSKVDMVRQASQMTGDLIREGVVLDGRAFEGNANPAYLFSRLNDIRPAMLAQATKSARAVAQQFAADSNSRLGAIRRASQGVFQVMSRDAEEPNPMEERASIEKKVRLVSTIDYYLID
jgi:uncharacterized protein